MSALTSPSPLKYYMKGSPSIDSFTNQVPADYDEKNLGDITSLKISSRTFVSRFAGKKTNMSGKELRSIPDSILKDTDLVSVILSNNMIEAIHSRFGNLSICGL